MTSHANTHVQRLGLTRDDSTVSGEADARIASIEDLFANGVCHQCGQPRGDRTDEPLRLERIEPGSDGAFAGVPSLSRSPTIMVFSAAFLALLTDAEREGVHFRRVLRRGGRMEFYELLRGVVHASFAVPAGGRLDLWTCDACGWKHQPPFWDSRDFPKALIAAVGGTWENAPSWYVSARDLPLPIPSSLTLGHATSPRLGLTDARWVALPTGTGMRRMRAKQVGILPDDLLDPNPSRRLLSQVDGGFHVVRPLPGA